MKRLRFLALVVALAGAPPLAAQAVFPEAYGLLYDLFANGDPNEGGSVFLSALVPMGGLGEGMGGAYTSMSRDNSFIEYNPAASSMLERTEVALYHNNWIADTRVEAAVYTIRFGSLGLGAAGKWLYLPFTEYDQYADRVSGGYYSEAIATLNASYRLFPGYYFHGLSLGANLKAAYRSFPDFDLDNDSVIDPDELGSGADQSAFALMLDAGAMTRFNFLKFYSSRVKNSGFGLALKNIGAPVMDEPLPTVGSAGLSWSPLRPLTLSFDISKPLNLSDLAASEAFYWSAGFLAQMTDFLGLQGGFQLKGSNPRLSLGAAVDIAPLTLLVNYTLDLATTFGPLNRLSLEARFDLGDRGRAEKAREVELLYLAGLDAYAAGDAVLAVQLWREALARDGGFDPARESLKVASSSLELLERLEEIRQLEGAGAQASGAVGADGEVTNSEGTP